MPDASLPTPGGNVTHTLYNICQTGMLLFGVLAVWYLGYYSEADPRRRWGFIFGLSSQPFWAIKSVIQHDWILLVITVLFTISWYNGFKVQQRRETEARNKIEPLVE